tara:strand:+ start:457 stop:780 length:324 start_codon:yes stop_codon:yes gene_type:complete
MSEDQLSLYEYLGKAAGQDLGKEVMKAALECDEFVEISEQKISTPAFDGVIKTYPKSFLDKFFKKEEKSSFRPEIKVEERINMLLNQVEGLESRVKSLEGGDDDLPF